MRAAKATTWCVADERRGPWSRQAACRPEHRAAQGRWRIRAIGEPVTLNAVIWTATRQLIQDSVELPGAELADSPLALGLNPGVCSRPMPTTHSSECAKHSGDCAGVPADWKNERKRTTPRTFLKLVCKAARLSAAGFHEFMHTHRTHLLDRLGAALVLVGPALIVVAAVARSVGELPPDDCVAAESVLATAGGLLLPIGA